MEDKQQHKISLIGNNLKESPAIKKVSSTSTLKKVSSKIFTPLHVESQFPKSERGKALRQIVAALIANIGPMNTGLIFGFSAIAIPQLTASDSSIPINASQASWIASLSSLSTPVGCILGGYLSDKIGRKKTLIVTEFPLVLGWALISLASSVEMIYAGRLLCGIGSGIVGAPARVYTSEVSQPHLRGMLTALSSVALSFGVLFQYTMGAYMTWNMASAVSCVVPIIAMIGMCMLPESPNYLVTHQKPEKAVESLAKLRGSAYNIQKEINHLQAFANKINAKKKLSTRETFDALLAPSCLKPFCILTVYFMLYQFSGVNTITFYAVEIFKDSGAQMDKNQATIILGALRFLFTIVGCVALRKCGRRPLSFISGIGCAVTMIGLGTYMYYKKCWEIDGVEPMYTWIPVACIFIFMITCTVGFLVVPWILIGELYPMKVRGLVGGLTTMMAHSFVFIVVKTYPLLTKHVDRHGAFLIYGFISVIATIFFYVYLPETKGRTLQEIEDYFSGRISTLKTKKSEKVSSDAVNSNNNNAINNLNNNNNNNVILTLENDKLLNENEKK